MGDPLSSVTSIIGNNNPTNAAGISVGNARAGGVVGAIGNLFGGLSQSQMYGYQAGVARLNAEINRKNADYTITAGEQSAATEGMKLSRALGSFRAAKGAGNIATNSGSAKDVQGSIKGVGDFNIATLRNNAARVAYGHLTQAAMDEAQASAYDAAGTNSLFAGAIGAYGSLLSGSTSVSSKWLQGNAVGFGR